MRAIFFLCLSLLLVSCELVSGSLTTDKIGTTMSTVAGVGLAVLLVETGVGVLASLLSGVALSMVGLTISQEKPPTDIYTVDKNGKIIDHVSSVQQAVGGRPFWFDLLLLAIGLLVLYFLWRKFGRKLFQGKFGLTISAWWNGLRSLGRKRHKQHELKFDKEVR